MVFTNDLTIDADHRAPHDHATDETATLLGRRTNSSTTSSSRVSHFGYAGFLIAFVTLSSSAFVFLLNRGATFPTEVGNIEAQVAKVQRPLYESPDILDVLSSPELMTSSFEGSETANGERYFTYEDFSGGESHQGGKGKPIFVVSFEDYEAQTVPHLTQLGNLIIEKAKQIHATILVSTSGDSVIDAIKDVELKLGCVQDDETSSKYCLILIFEGETSSTGVELLKVSRVDENDNRVPITDVNPKNLNGLLMGSDAIVGETYAYDSLRRSSHKGLSDGVLKQPEVMKKSQNVEGYCPVNEKTLLPEPGCTRTTLTDNIYVVTLEVATHTTNKDKSNITIQSRLFNGKLPGSTIKIKAGDTLQIQFQNKLKFQEGAKPCYVDTTCKGKGCKVTNDYCQPDDANLHFHGFWGSGEEPSDDVEMAIPPQSNYSYSSFFRSNHMPGTHWVHTHHHGSSSLQVGAGAAFALIVEDDPNTIPIPPEVETAKDVILVVQHFSIGDTTKIAKATFVDDDKTDAVFKFEAGPGFCDDPDLCNFRLVNGQYQPKLHIKRGEWQRLRVIFAGWGVGDPASLNFKISNNSDGEACETNLLAKDGIYLRDYPRPLTSFPIPAAGRADIMVRCEKKGTYSITHFDTDEVLFTIESEGPLVKSEEPSFNFFENQKFPNYLEDVRHETPSEGCSCDTSMGFSGGKGAINGVQYQPYKAVHSIQVGKIIERKIRGISFHPYHQHVNPFQITEGFGRGEIGYGYFKNGDWHDNIRCRGKSEITVRHKPGNIIGKMMLHCHRLDHEDKGMMAQEKISFTEPCTCDRNKMNPKEFQQYSNFITKEVRHNPTLH